LLAPGGLNSTVDFWSRMPLNPLEAFSNELRVIAMDQRNAGRSSGPLDTSDPWQMYAGDQLAVLDHLGIDQAKGAHFDSEMLDSFGNAMFDPDFVFSVSRDFLRSAQTPLLLLYGTA
jgi:hypothetical protein